MLINATTANIPSLLAAVNSNDEQFYNAIFESVIALY